MADAGQEAQTAPAAKPSPGAFLPLQGGGQEGDGCKRGASQAVPIPPMPHPHPSPSRAGFAQPARSDGAEQCSAKPRPHPLEGEGERGDSFAPGPAALLEALRASGAAGREPVRLRFLEALARRAEGHTGEARRLLDDKLARTATALGERCARPQTASPVAGTAPAPASPLAELLAHIRDHALPEAPSYPHHAPADIAPRGELKSVAYFQRTWSQMSVDQQLAQALAQVPDNAGPFNPQRLAVQALQRMRDTAPDYLRQMLIYMDGLIWLEQASDATSKPRIAPGSAERKGRHGGKRPDAKVARSK